VLLWTACIFTGTCSLTQDRDCTAAYCVRETNNLKELHGFETHAKDLFAKPTPFEEQHVDVRLAAESVKLEVRFRRIRHQIATDSELRRQEVFDPVTLSEQLVQTQTTRHLGIPSPPQGRSNQLY